MVISMFIVFKIQLVVLAYPEGHNPETTLVYMKRNHPEMKRVIQKQEKLRKASRAAAADTDFEGHAPPTKKGHSRS